MNRIVLLLPVAVAITLIGCGPSDNSVKAGNIKLIYMVFSEIWSKVRFRSRGTNLGEFLGNPPTGNHVEISEVVIFRLSNGKIIEQWVYPDMLSLQRQLGKKEQ